MNYVRHVSGLTSERMFLLSMKLARFSLMKVQVFALGIGTRK